MVPRRRTGLRRVVRVLFWTVGVLVLVAAGVVYFALDDNVIDHVQIADVAEHEAAVADGGGSSTMYFNGEIVNNPVGRGDERSTGDIVYVA